jgi:hypothetical protein
VRHVSGQNFQLSARKSPNIWRRPSAGRGQWVLPQEVQKIGQKQLLMLLLVVAARLNEDLRLGGKDL